jgi:hypothetical protein
VPRAANTTTTSSTWARGNLYVRGDQAPTGITDSAAMQIPVLSLECSLCSFPPALAACTSWPNLQNQRSRPIGALGTPDGVVGGVPCRNRLLGVLYLGLAVGWPCAAQKGRKIGVCSLWQGPSARLTHPGFFIRKMMTLDFTPRGLTPLEKHVLSEMTKCISNRAVAERLGVAGHSEETCESHFAQDRRSQQNGRCDVGNEAPAPRTNS